MLKKIDISGEFFISPGRKYNFNRITLQWLWGDPEYVRVIGYAYDGFDGNDVLLMELLNECNDFVPYAIKDDAKQDNKDFRYIYYADIVRGLK